ncbi:MAG TPA: aquaporin [Candidatus Xenobia bacterium]|nr:aquaporin [Candidatus Xenobia bacterium]
MTMREALRLHWPEYLMEAAELGLFMISAGLFGILLEYPGSPMHQALPNPMLRRVLMGLAMGATAIAIIYSPMGKQSGAHFNPAVTLTFFRLGKVKRWDALFYILAQFFGGLVGILLVAAAFRAMLAHPNVNFVATVPGSYGTLVAWVAEVVITFILMAMILRVTSSRLARFTGGFAGLLVATYIVLESPLSGMSMNPARSFASAVPAHLLSTLWIYFTAPPLGMLLAAELYLGRMGRAQVACAKLHHQNDKRCIHCGAGM